MCGGSLEHCGIDRIWSNLIFVLASGDRDGT